MRFLLVWLLGLLLAGCGAPGPAPTPPPAVELPAILALPLLMETPQQWSGRELTLIAPLPEGKQGRVLAPAMLSPDGRSVTLLDDPRKALWLAAPLPANITAKAGEGPTFLKLRGRLSPPGGYGTDARYVYQFSADTITLLEAEDVTLPNLADNQRAFDGSLLRIQGILLAGTQSAVLATQTGAGGIPPANARQIKLRGPLEPRFLEGLQQSGEVRYGPATIVGWWQSNALTPFLVGQPAPAQAVLPSPVD